jgi:hypothetical protein
MYGRIHADICNLPVFVLPGIKTHIKLTKSKSAFYLLSADEDSKVNFKFEEALLYVKRVRATPSILAAHNEALLSSYPARYNFTRVELKTFTFGSGSKSLSIDNAVLGLLPKRLIFSMIRVKRIRTLSHSDITTSLALRCM